uniref:Putative secreted protein n=1 Tax=Xenopsylla cheopis TaxID=163159 RepID=A0A6M2DNS5_XENCH
MNSSKKKKAEILKCRLTIILVFIILSKIISQIVVFNMIFTIKKIKIANCIQIVQKIFLLFVQICLRRKECHIIIKTLIN